MSRGARSDVEQRVLLRAPTERDAVLTASILEKNGLDCCVCTRLDDVRRQLDVGAGVLLLAEEAVQQDEQGSLARWLWQQPKWSDLPVLLIARPGADSSIVTQGMDLLGNVTVLERPTRAAALVSAIHAALRARERQYQIRDHLEERERGFQVQAVLAAIVNSSDDAIISKTLEGEIMTWNAGAERLFGYSAAEAVGQSITLLIPKERLDEEAVLLERLRRGERIEHFETVRVTKGGRRLDISLTVSPLRDSNGKLFGASKVARDITDQKRTAAALVDADRRKDEFLAVLAHELRNPLAPIRNSVHLLRLNRHEDPVVERVTEIMERQVNHMVRLVDDLLEISRITRGKIELRKELVEVAALVRSAVETSRPIIEAAGHQLSLSIPSEPLTLEGDPVRLTQVLANLLNNAAKYTDPGGQISVTARKEGEQVVLAVRDDGTGIAPEMLPRVFEMFMQVDRNLGRSQGGLGIGLTLTKSLVEMHGGSIEARSEGAGRGSEFIVRLPLVTGRAPDSRGSKTERSAALAPRRVLVVDDNEDAAETLGMVLKLLGVEVRVVYNGPDALAMLPTYQPAVVMLDIGMPGMDGHEVARRVRMNPEFREVTLIALTGWGQDEDRQRTHEAGFDYHLVKPTDVGSVQELLKSLQHRASGGRDGDYG